MPSPIILLALFLAFALSNAYSYVKGAKAADTRWTAQIQTDRANAEAAARATEQRTQEAANAIARRHAAEVQMVRRNLELALDSLRSRPERQQHLPDAPRADCQGGTGAELSRPDAEFLAREASRADDIRAGLAACYQHVDATLK